MACACHQASQDGCAASWRQNPAWSSPRDAAIAPAAPPHSHASRLSQVPLHHFSLLPRVACWL